MQSQMPQRPKPSTKIPNLQIHLAASLWMLSCCSSQEMQQVSEMDCAVSLVVNMFGLGRRKNRTI